MNRHRFHDKRNFLVFSLCLCILFPAWLSGQDACSIEDCDLVLMDIEARTDWTTTCDLINIPRPAPGAPDLRQICDPTFLLIKDPTCGAEGTENNYIELSSEESCIDESLPCEAVGFANFCISAKLEGTYTISNVGSSAGDLVFNLDGCTKIYRGDDLFNPICALEGPGEQIGVSLPSPSPENPQPQISGAFEALETSCSLNPDEAAGLFADICAAAGNFCFEAFSDGFTQVTLSTGNLVAESTITGGARICASFVTYEFDVLVDLVEPNCATCDGTPSPNGIAPVQFTLPDDGNDGFLAEYEKPENYRLVIDAIDDGDNAWDQTLTPTGSGQYAFEGLADGDYQVAAIYLPLAGGKLPEDAELCGFCKEQVTIGLVAEPEIEVVIMNTCSDDAGAGDGSIELIVDESKNIGFEWENGEMTNKIENLSAGQYCVTVTYGPARSESDDTGRCSVCLCYEVEEIDISCSIEGTPRLCTGQATTLTANVEGGSGAYSYLWSTGETTPAIEVSPDVTTIYQVTVTDELAGGNAACESVCEFQVEVFDLTCSITGNNEVCAGEMTTLTANAEGGSGNYSYLWTTGATTPIITVSSASTQTYQVTITDVDASGEALCSVICGIQVNVTNPVCTVEGDDLICLGQSTTLTAVPEAGDGGPFSYEWSTGATTASITVSPMATTAYQVTVTDESSGDGACQSVCFLQVLVLDPVCSITGNDLVCSGQSTTLTATVTDGSGDYSYAWSTGATSASIEVSPLETTTYDLTITDNLAGCTLQCDYQVLVTNPTCTIQGDELICVGQSTTLTALPDGGTGEYSYLWSTGATTPSVTVSPAANTTYQVTITDITADPGGACTSVCTFDVSVFDPGCTITGDDLICAGQSTTLTAAAMGGSGSYSYEWNTGATTASVEVSPLASTTYSVTITDELANGDSGCEIVCEYEVTVLDPTCTITGDALICSGQSSTLTASVEDGTGDYIYEWSTGATTASITVSPLETTDYSVTITDNGANGSGGCRFICDFEVGVLNPTCAVDGQDQICVGESTTLTAGVEGGSDGYSYQWSTGATTPAITVSPTTPTTYLVTITDNAAGGNCFFVCDFMVDVIDPTCEITGDKEVCPGEMAMLTANPTGGTGNYTYEWSTGETTQSIKVCPFETTTYSVVITTWDEEGNPLCTFTCEHEVEVINPTCVIEGPMLICPSQSAELRVRVSGVTGPFTYLWSTGETTPTITVSPTEATTYDVLVTQVDADGNPGCTTFCSIEVHICEPTCNITGDNELCLGESTVLTANPAGGSGDYSYAWSTGATGPSIEVSPQSTTSYTVTITDNGAGGTPPCTFTCDYEVWVNGLVCTISGEDQICFGESTTLTADVSGGSGAYTYLWCTGETTSSISVSPAAKKTYAVTITDLVVEKEEQRCLTVCEKMVDVSNPTCTIIDTRDLVCGAQSGAFRFIAGGGRAPYAYQVTDDNGATIATGQLAADNASATIDQLPAGSYFIGIEDAAGCVSECAVSISTVEGNGEYTGCLACNDVINLTLDSDCSVPVTLDMVAEGDQGGCTDFSFLEQVLEVIVYDDNYPTIDGQAFADNVVDGPGEFTYVIRLKEGYEDCIEWEHCWGTVNAEDKSGPQVCAPSPVNGLHKRGADVFEPAFGHGPIEEKPASFNYLTCDDFERIYREPRSYTDPDYPWFTGQTLANTGLCLNKDNENEGYVDPFTFYYDGCADDPCGQARLVEVDDQLLDLSECDADRDRLLEITAFFAGRLYGEQVAAGLRLHYWAIDKVIARYFIYEDELGNRESDVQYIFFQRPYIHLPLCKVEIDDCLLDGQAPTPELLTDPAGADAPFAAPFFYNAVCERVYLSDHKCNFTIGYEDTVLPGPENCGDKILRTWTILDWCWKSTDNYPFFLYGGHPLGENNGYSCYGDYEGYPFYVVHREWENKVFKFEQHLIVGDTEPPVVSCPATELDKKGAPLPLELSTGPFSCTAAVAPPSPEVEGECGAWTWEFELIGDRTDPKTGWTERGVILGTSTNGVLPGVLPGDYILRYMVTDACGNTGTVDCALRVVDEVEPVAICNESLNVSIGGAFTIADGIARVAAVDVDEGSWDNCGEVTLEVRRSIDLECLDLYSELVYGLQWPQDFAPRLVDGRYVAYTARRAAPESGVELGEIVLYKERDGRFYTGWREAVFFTCCDVSPEEPVIVELRVTDAAGNSNTCWLNVLIEDKLPPRCTVANEAILCTELDFDPTDPEQVAARFGAAEDILTIIDNCGATIAEELNYDANNCGTGIIERVFTVTDGFGQSSVCSQTITIDEVNAYTIDLPGDLGSAICGETPEGEGLQYASTACDVLAVSRDTARFDAAGDACFKLFITYSVINWCEYDGESPEPTLIGRDIDEDDLLEEPTFVDAAFQPVSWLNDKRPQCGADWSRDDLDADGEIFVVQLFGALDSLREERPRQILVRATCAGGETSVGFAIYEYNEFTECYEVLRRQPNIVAECRQGNQVWTPGFYEYTQVVKVYDNEGPEITVESEQFEFCAFGDPETSCDGPVELVFSIADVCTPDEVEIRSVQLDAFNEGVLEDIAELLTPIDGTSYLLKGSFPPGEHRIVVQAADGCGNIAGRSIPFSVVDCKSPAPICIQSLSVDIMPVDIDGDGRVDGGMNTVFVESFIAADIDDCSPFDTPRRVQYYIFKDTELPEGIEGLTPDDFTEEATSLVFTCDDMGPVLIYVVALDAAGNWDYCAVMADVRPGIQPNPCEVNDEMAAIAGLIINEEDEPVEKVSVMLSGRSSQTYETKADGHYSFNGLETGYDYSVAPMRDDDFLNGVSTFDLVLITKHILGVKPLNSPYRLIAADANKSGSVTTIDMIQLRKLILGLDSQLRSNTSWRFVRADHRFPDPDRPFDAYLPEVLSINNLEEEALRDFIAVKIGDVNGSARFNSLAGTDTRSRAGTFHLDVAERALQAGETYTVGVHSDELGLIQGYQLTLTFDAELVELVDVLPGIVGEEHMGVFADEGALTISWNAAGPAPAADAPLFELVLQARGDAPLSRALGVSSRITAAEAYDLEDQPLDVALRFDGDQDKVTGMDFELFQNYPNPFRSTTTIGFQLPEAGEATLTIQDVSGRTLRILRGEFERGYNEVELLRETLPGGGVLYYTLQADDHLATRKMIIIE